MHARCVSSTTIPSLYCQAVRRNTALAVWSGPEVESAIEGLRTRSDIVVFVVSADQVA